MDIKEKKQRVKDYFYSMKKEELEEMTLRCGGEIILPSEESSYVRCTVEE